MKSEPAPPSTPPDSPRPSLRRRMRALVRISMPSMIAIGIGSAAIVYVVVAGLAIQSPGRTAPRSPQRGISCPYLYRAAQVTNDTQQFTELVRVASRVGVATLHTTGQLFGVAEETAFELQSDLPKHPPTSPYIATVLARARKACTHLGAWHG